MNQSSKSHYFLVELLVNCLLFAVAAAICIAIFAHGNMTGKKSAALSMLLRRRKTWRRVLRLLRETCRCLPLLDAGEEGGVYTLRYDADWQRLHDNVDAVYELRAVIDIDEKNMLQADISVTDKEGMIYTLHMLRYLSAKSGGKI